MIPRSILNITLLLIFVQCFCTENALAATLGAEINNETFRLNFKNLDRSNQSVVSAGILYHEEDGKLYHLGLTVESQVQGSQNLYGALGGKYFYVDLEHSQDGNALGLGGHVRFRLPNAKAFNLLTEAYYSPSVLSFNDISHVLDTSVALEYQMLQRGSVYIGYRKVRINLENGSKGNLDEGAFFGLRISL